MSLIADSLKKAVKEKSFNVTPGINLLKNLGSQAKSSSKFDSKEVKRFVILIVAPAAVLAYLLLANPFDPKKKSQKISPPLMAKAPVPAVKPVPKPAPKQTTPPPPQKSASQAEPENIPMIEPGMKEVFVLEIEGEAQEPKPVAGPKKRTASKKPDLGDSFQEPAIEPNPVAIERPKPNTPSKRDMGKMEPPQPFSEMPRRSAESNRPSRTSKTKQDIFKNSDYYFNRAIFYQQSQNWEKALTNYSKAAELDPNNPDIYNNIGVIYKELRQYDQAIDEFLRAIYLKPGYAKPYNNIGVVYFSKKDFSGAIRNYQKAISIDPKNLEALNNLAVAYKRIDQLEKAKNVLNQALKINLAHAGTHYNLAVLFEKEGKLKSAIHFYQRFVELGSVSHPGLTAQVKRHIQTLK